MKEKLSPFHVTILLFITQTGTVLFTLPRLLAEHFGTNGWICLVIVYMAVIVNLMLISAVYRMGNGISIFEIMERSIPKIFLYPFYIAIASLWAIVGCMAAKQYVLIFQMIAFPTTSPMVFKLAFDLLAFSLIVKSIYNIAKAATVFFWLSSWMLLLMFYFYGEFEWSRLTPFLLRDGAMTMNGFFSIFIAFLGYEVCLLLFPYSDKRTKLMKAAQIGNFLTFVTYLYISIIAFGFYGHEHLKTLQFPMLNILAYIQFPFLQGTENLLFGFFLFSILITTAMYWWGAKEMCQRMFSINRRLLAIMILLVSFCISYIPDSLSEVNNWLTSLGFMELGVAFALPVSLIVLLLAHRKRGESF